MKRYKVTCKATLNATSWGNYFDTEKEAKAFAKNYTGFSAKVSVVEMELHHSAKTRGYWPRRCQQRTPYEGRFGVGYIQHHYNADSRECYHYSNNYHIIEYIVEKTK